MACSETGTCTDITLGGEYQVFLSFRGPDTRRGFTNSLYHALVDAGIRVFMDDEELRPGERISGNLLQAIDNSKLYIPIFSKNYASSHWCLRELAKMVENTSKSKEDGKKVILPIFYDMKPDDVKLKTMLYSEAISNLEQKMEDQEKKFSSEDVEKWRQALKEIDGTKGWELEKYSGYGDLIKSVVNEVVVRLKTRQRRVTEDLVGIEDRIAAINNLLDIDSGGVQLIGIYGMGGIGKTTLAKIIFNQLCPHFEKNCSFLDDVRETAKTKGSLVELQKKLLSDISNPRVACNIDNMDQGMTMIGEKICKKKMLIVLDDVDEGDQIQKLIGVNSLCCGTRILVTTRDKSVLKFRGFKYEILPYEMEGLSKKEALQLFSRHAFDENSPPTNYYTLSEGIVSTAGGLPLALEAIGSLLFGQKEKTIWEEMLEKLRKTPTGDVLGKLKISYDGLETDQQQIFLDVACFCIGKKKINPIYMWKDCGFRAEYAIHVLSNRCMIKVLNDDILWMHDQFRDLGRAIVIQENPQYPGKRTRLWAIDDVICELRSTEIKGSVQALCLQAEFGNPITVTAEQIRRFPYLQFLWLSNITCKGDFMGCFSKLKWIILEYPEHSPWNQYKHYAPNNMRLENVIVMNLSCPDFNEDEVNYLIKGGRKLKVLTLQLNRLIHGTPTFPEYSVLEKLTIFGCPSLMEIDCSMGKLRWLTDLIVESCSALIKLPEQIGELRNLQHLSLKNCHNLRELPDSVSKLESLMTLDVSNTSITRLPDSIGRLPSLSSANVSYTPIVEMPSTMSKLLCLQKLDLYHCNGIQELANLSRSLITLRLRSTSLLTVPNLSYLTNLVELHLSDGSEGTDTAEVIQTYELQWIGRLSKLRKLHFCFLNVRPRTKELGYLSLLKELYIYGLDLQTLKQLPSNLIVLRLYETRGQKAYLDGFRQFIKVTVKWPTVHVRASIPSSSREPREAPELTDRWRGAFLIPSSLKMLQELCLSGCPEVQDIQFTSTLESLVVFSVGDCISLKSLGGLSNLKNLKQLYIKRCISLTVVEGIDELEFLHDLTVSECRSIKRIFDTSNPKIPNDCQIKITSCGELLDSYRVHPFFNWESYKKKILNGTKQASDSKIITKDFETERGYPQQKTVRLLPIHSSSLFLLLYLLCISALF